MNRHRTLRTRIAVLVAALSLLLAATALAAHPRAGKRYTGFMNAAATNGHKQPVSFKVSSNGKRLLGFKWTGFGCVGGGGPGNPWTDPYNIYKLGPIKVSSKGTFSIKNSKWSSSVHPPTKVTYSTVTGRFKTSKKATGTVHFKQKLAGETPFCTGKLTFTAKTP